MSLKSIKPSNLSSYLIEEALLRKIRKGYKLTTGLKSGRKLHRITLLHCHCKCRHKHASSAGKIHMKGEYLIIGRYQEEDITR